MRSFTSGNCLNTINNAPACSVLFLSTAGLFPVLRKTLEHSTASLAPKFFCVLETTLSCSKTVLSMLNHCLLRYFLCLFQQRNQIYRFCINILFELCDEIYMTYLSKVHHYKTKIVEWKTYFFQITLKNLVYEIILKKN